MVEVAGVTRSRQRAVGTECSDRTAMLNSIGPFYHVVDPKFFFFPTSHLDLLLAARLAAQIRYERGTLIFTHVIDLLLSFHIRIIYLIIS